MPISTIGTSSIAALGYGFKNRILNGGMQIDQRNAGASITPTGYTLDRWYYNSSQASKFTCQQNQGSVTPPAGFVNYLGLTSSSSYSVGSGETFGIQERIEGLNCSDLGWGSANAQTVTLSFWVRSSITGTHSGSFYNSDFSRGYAFTFTVSSANTWEQKTVTVAGDTSGTWLTTNGVGIVVNFNLGSGSTLSRTAGSWGAGCTAATGAVSVVGTNGATFYITGVQLEKGNVATSFDYRPYGTELALCQRYAVSTFPTGTAWGQNRGAAGCVAVSSVGVTGFGVQMPFRMPVTMRATPTTITTYNPSAANANARYFAGSSDLSVSNLPFSQNSMTGVCYTSDTTGTSLGAAIGLHYSVECEL